MIRREVHRAVGGFDESIREGFEDWDFWLRCANAGFWGGTLPEFLDWYRRRRSHADRWKTWDGGEKKYGFGEELRRRFRQLQGKEVSQNRVPRAPAERDRPGRIAVRERARQEDTARSDDPSVAGDGGRRQVRAGLAPTAHGTRLGSHRGDDARRTDPWHAEFGRYTPDIFLLHRFLRLVDYPRFLRYLIQSRQVDAVFVSHSEFGYLLLPYLRAHFPHVTFLDFCHIEEQWKNGGYPRMAVEYQEQLDLNSCRRNI